MPKYNKIFTTSTILIATSCLLAACASSKTDTSNSSQTTTSSTSELSSGKISTTLSKVDNSKWLYNEEDDTYYQLGIPYAEKPTNSSEQTLSIFIPGAYVKATDNGDGTYTASIDGNSKVGDYTSKTAPIVLPIDTPGYAAMSALTDYTSDAATYTKQGMIYVSAGLRGRDSGAPSGVTDAKAAIRYLRYTESTIAGDLDSIFVNGMSGGGAQSAIIGASGDSSLYDNYLKEIGAVEGVSDAVAGVMAWCPVTNLDTANEAYEWNMGSSRTGLDTATQTLSDRLAASYASYINELALKDEAGNTLSLTESENGIYQSGSYYDYVKETVEDSLNTFLASTSFPYDGSSASTGNMMGGRRPSSVEGGISPSDGASTERPIENIDNIQRTGNSIALELSGNYQSAQEYIDALNSQSQWVTYNQETKKVSITSLADFVKYLKTATKSVGAFDSLDASQGENELFGVGSGGIHWDARMANLLKGTEYEEAYSTDLSTRDALGTDLTTRINMYTPLYYLSDYYEDGENASTVASYWRIRSGISQGDTALSTEINLALALKNYGIESVDFATVWGQQHVKAEVTGDSESNFISWINNCLANK